MKFAILMTPNSIKSLIRKHPRWTLLLLGGALLTAGCGVDIGGPGRGPAQNLLGGLGLSLILVTAFDKRGRLTSRILLILVASYCALMGGELAVRLTRRPPPAAWKQYHHLYRPDLVVGYTLTPNWQGRFNDGYARGNISVNSLGHRDNEPAPTSKHRILLLGDSFTFGALLDQSEIIDKQVERLDVGIDAYNLGVGGYGLPAIVETLRRSDLPAQETFYLFFNNDLQNDNLLPDNGKTVVDGHLVPKTMPDGSPYTEALVRQKIAQAIEEHESKHAVVDLQLFLLPHLRQLMSAAGNGFYDSRDLPIRRAPLGGDHGYSEENVRLAISHTQELRRLAAARAMRFYVVIIPTLAEVRAREYSWPTVQYLKGLEKQNMYVVPLIQSLTEEDYFPHDGHFSPGGARVAAEAIDRALKPRIGPEISSGAQGAAPGRGAANAPPRR